MGGDRSGRGDGRTARPYGWAPLVALAATQGLETGERQALAQAVEGIRHSFGVSDAAVGWLPTAALLVGVLAALPMGAAADRSRRTTLVAVAAVVWSVGVFGAGIATSFAMLFGARLLLGALEAGAPPSIALLSDYYPVRERGKVMGLYQGGALLGGLLGLVGGGVAVSLLGWRAPFFFWAPLGLVVAAFVAGRPEPPRGERDAEAHLYDPGHHLPPADADVATDHDEDEVEPADAGGPPVHVHIPMRQALSRLKRIRTFWFGLVAIGVAQLLLTGLQFWGVPYFRRVHGLEPAAAGGVAALLGLGAAVGVLGGGPLADRMIRRGIVAGRVYVVAIGAFGATAVLMPAFASTHLAVTVPLFVLGGAFLTLPIAPAEALLADVVVAELRGRSSAIRSLVRGVSQTGPLWIGFLSTWLGLRVALVAFAPVYAVGGVLVLLAARTYAHDHAAVLRASRRGAGGSASPILSDMSVRELDAAAEDDR